MSYRVALALTALLSIPLSACGGDDSAAADAGAPDAFYDPNNPLQPPPPEEGVQFAMDVTAPAQSEVWKCKVGPIPGVNGGGILPFHRVVSKQSDNIHHMDLSILTQTDLPDGTYDCADLYAAHPSLMDEIIIYASQHPEQQLTLPEGTTADVPAALKTMLEVHYVNTTEEEQTVFTRVNAYLIDGVSTQAIWGNAVRDLNLNIPAGGTADEWTRCEMNGDIDLIVLSTHTHALGMETDVYKWDGQQTGELLYTNLDWHAPTLMDLTQAPIHVPAGQGFEFHCHYQNPGATDVHWGFKSTDEMCQIAIVYTPGEMSLKCTPVESSDGVLQ